MERPHPIFCNPRLRRDRHVLAPRDPSDPATAPLHPSAATTQRTPSTLPAMATPPIVAPNASPRRSALQGKCRPRVPDGRRRQPLLQSRVPGAQPVQPGTHATDRRQEMPRLDLSCAHRQTDARRPPKASSFMIYAAYYSRKKRSKKTEKDLIVTEIEHACEAFRPFPAARSAVP